MTPRNQLTLPIAATLAIAFLMGNTASTEGVEGPPKLTCASAPDVKGKSRQRFDSSALMVVANELESQGESDFHLKYTSPTAECVIETFQVADATVTASYNPWEKGQSTLNYRFAVERPSGKSEVLVLFSGMAALVSGGYRFHVSDEKSGVISWYAMFKEAPAYPAVKDLVEKIVSGGAEPLLAVRWPSGAKEGEFVAFDTTRLK